MIDIDWEKRAKGAEQALEQLKRIMSANEEGSELLLLRERLAMIHAILEGELHEEVETVIKRFLDEHQARIRELRIAKKQRDILEEGLRRAAGQLALKKCCDDCPTHGGQVHTPACYISRALECLTSVAPSP
jgi:hypothetical protein